MTLPLSVVSNRTKHLAIIAMAARRPRPATTIIAIAAPMFFGAMYVLLSMPLGGGEEDRSPAEAEDDNKKADAGRGAGVGGMPVPRAARMKRVLMIGSFIFVVRLELELELELELFFFFECWKLEVWGL
jgi:hypothetical protein